MKEITRIHIAKVAYDIELAAKKELETYMAALERYAEDPSILEDIEIRMTELLEENGVAKDGVITTSDVVKLRERLGEPHNFAEDSDAAALPTDTIGEPRRRLYRDGDKAVLGGVLSGISMYFGINPLWARLIFIVLLFGSFGTMAIVYIVLWIALPPARTAAEKLELEGKPVTLAAIKDRSERIIEGVHTNQTAKTVQSVLFFLLGLSFSIAAVGALLVTVFVGSSLVFGLGTSGNSPYAEMLLNASWQYTLAFGLFIVSGLLLAALNTVLAVATFSRSWTKRIGVSVVAIILAGIVAFSSGVGMITYNTWNESEQMRQSMTTTNQRLSADFAETKKLMIDVSNAPSFGAPSVVYIASSGESRAEIAHAKGKVPQFDVAQDGDVATITVKQELNSPWQPGAPVRIYGPALAEFTVKGGAAKYTNETTQDRLALTATDSGTIYTEGTFEAVTARTTRGGTIDLEDTTVRTLIATTDGGQIEAGVVRNLTVTQPEACSQSAETSGENVVEVEGVSSGTLTHGGTERSVRVDEKISTPCGIIMIGEADEE